MSAEIKSLVLDTWAGRRYYAVELVGQTPKKTRVRVLTPGGVMLPGRRYVNCGETVLVPKHAVVDLPQTPDRTVALRKLLETRRCAIRACLHTTFDNKGE